MKKIFAILILGLFLFFWFSPVLADGPVKCCKIRHQIEIDGVVKNPGDILGPAGVTTGTDICSHTGTLVEVSNWAAFCTLDAIKTIADIINTVAIIFSGAVFAVAAILYFTSAGNPTRLATAQKFFFSGLIGALIVLLSNFIISFGRFILGI